ncbi:hypothetical protein [Nitrosovibrio sp. Nv4]|uniref:hypothetical protein n=1 Tax=Nitrosovibrio sp. Nv4 TaxID=1945880 RepID=UPI000BCF00FE|nr:hypothetical protein [Nitrosovibrio sp. Nv4]SOD42182.1 hypothetical protein SAMN06298226_2513 [Nitrosovibrio sp. Nv4]
MPISQQVFKDLADVRYTAPGSGIVLFAFISYDLIKYLCRYSSHARAPSRATSTEHEEEHGVAVEGNIIGRG